MLDSGQLTNDERAARISDAIKRSGKQKAEIAELLGVTPQAITGWERTGRIGKGTVAGLALVTGVPVDHFLRRDQVEASDDGHYDIPGYAQPVGLSEGSEVRDDAAEYLTTHKLKFRAESLARKRLSPASLAVFYGKGDSMEPRIHDGDAVLFDQSDTRPRDGAMFVILVPGVGAESYSVKRCEIIDDLVLFKADNPKGDHGWRKPRRVDDPKFPIKIIGRVRWIGSWED